MNKAPPYTIGAKIAWTETTRDPEEHEVKQGVYKVSRRQYFQSSSLPFCLYTSSFGILQSYFLPYLFDIKGLLCTISSEYQTGKWYERDHMKNHEKEVLSCPWGLEAWSEVSRVMVRRSPKSTLCFLVRKSFIRTS